MTLRASGRCRNECPARRHRHDLAAHPFAPGAAIAGSGYRVGPGAGDYRPGAPAYLSGRGPVTPCLRRHVIAHRLRADPVATLYRRPDDGIVTGPRTGACAGIGNRVRLPDRGVAPGVP